MAKNKKFAKKVQKKAPVVQEPQEDEQASEDVEAQQQQQQQEEQKPPANTQNNAHGNDDNDEEVSDQNDFLHADDIEDKRKVIVVLEQCPLQTAKLRKDIVLLNSDDHRHYISRVLNRDYSHYRPDIVHQSLLTLMDSPLNKAGFLKVYIRTESGVIIDISPNTKIPRTFKRFAALMAQILTKLRIRAVESSQTLLKVIKNPITAHLPPDALKIGTSCKARLVNFKDFIKTLSKNAPVVYAVGGVAKGDPGRSAEYIDDCICVSRYPLSASCCLSRMLTAYEDLWNVV